ncbi:beta-lactamase-like protein [Bombardia bombarda]|uniref:Beta-lactamase-like protein n=1 Tax=Bombardia bombarda TaxID=252184 RepID=A0AA39X906_9PEZI|nr:beta-lactamase-like protein [Bombardia bombarda]
MSASAKSLPTVQVHALSGGHFSLPEEQFVFPSSPSAARSSVPSLCFLIQHKTPISGCNTRIIFDLGVRRDVQRYSEPIQRHVATRQPMTTDPDVVKSLGVSGGLTPGDIHCVIYSHVHWDHVGEPRDFPSSTFIVGHGSLALLGGTSTTLRGGHSFFEADLLDPARTIELSDPSERNMSLLNSKDDGPTMDSVASDIAKPQDLQLDKPWGALSDFSLPSTLDLFGDGSLHIVDAPGHLPGHINLLARISSEEGGTRWVYLAGDSCHDRRIMRGEREIGEWKDQHGHTCCIHADRSGAEDTIRRIQGLEALGVEVIFAHDVEWEADVRNANRFWGAMGPG